jgi:cyanophycin synthetase
VQGASRSAAALEEQMSRPKSGERIPRRWLQKRAFNARIGRLLFRRSVLTAMITGSNGKTTTTNMLARILKEAGHKVGKTNTDGIYIDGRQVWRGDSSGYKAAGWVLTEPGVTAAVLETARGDILNRGLYLKRVDAAAITNVGLEHIGDRGVDTPEQMAQVKKKVTDAARRAVVLNADDTYCLQVAAAYPVARLTLVSCKPDNPSLRRHLDAGGRGLSFDPIDGDGAIVLQQGALVEELMPIDALPAAMGGSLLCNVYNAMTAAGLALGMGLSPAEIARGLARFRLDVVDNPGRFTLLQRDGRQVLVNYGSNPLALVATMPAISRISVAGRRICFMTSPDNRADDHFVRVAREIAGRFDEYLVYTVDRYSRVHERGWTTEQIAAALTALGVASDRVATFSTLADATAAAFARSRPGDLLVVFGETMDNVRDVLDALPPRAASH